MYDTCTCMYKLCINIMYSCNKEVLKVLYNSFGGSPS